MNLTRRITIRFGLIFAVSLLAGALIGPSGARAQVTAFKQAVAEAASSDRDIAAFYRQTGYKPIWTGKGNRDRARRKALLKVLNDAELHGLPVSRYKPDELLQLMRRAKTPRDLGMVEVALSQTFLRYARDVQTGMLKPSAIDETIAREVPYRSRVGYLVNFSKSSPAGYLKSLPPKHAEYRGLMKARLDMERVIARGGWGPKVPKGKLEPGDSGNKVVALRNRLIAMGYMKRSSSKSYDAALQEAVQKFQLMHGLNPDGVAGKGTIAEINRSPSYRLASILVAMERQRWMNMDRGKRHVLVNQADFTARIIDNGKVTFETRAVIGKNIHDQRSPEFSDVMEHMVINPSWHVPRSIATKEYLPVLQKNPEAVSHLIITDVRGQRIDRAEMDFTQYTETDFPFDMRQPPSRGNALGRVKFMFPNKHNIYLHDTPHKNLFARERRAYSHGCIRLADPFDFAYTLLARQERNPKDYFHKVLKTGVETTVPLKQPIPVHLDYRTAFVTPKGDVEFRRDVYGRDAKIWKAMQSAGLALPSVQG